MTQREAIFNWVVPVKSAKGYSMGDLRVNLKTSTVYIGSGFLLNKFVNVDRNSVKVAFILDGKEDSLLVINPKDGIPYFQFKKAVTTGKVSRYQSIKVQNKDLCMLFARAFGLEKNSITEFSLNPESMGSIQFFRIKPTEK